MPLQIPTTKPGNQNTGPQFSALNNCVAVYHDQWYSRTSDQHSSEHVYRADDTPEFGNV